MLGSSVTSDTTSAMGALDAQGASDITLTFESLSAHGVAAAVEKYIPIIATQLRPDVHNKIKQALKTESSQRGRSILQMMIDNNNIACEDHVPICQDTGYVWIYLEVGQEENVPANIFSEVNSAVARAYDKARLRKSLLKDAFFDRTNTQDNTPAFVELGFRPGRGATLHIMLKGGGSDNASRVVMLPPGAGYNGIKSEILKCVLEKGSSACPPLIIGIGIGSTFDKVAGLAKKALLRSADMVSSDPKIAKLEQDLLAEVNALGVGPAGLGGDTTALCINVNTAPCHIAALPLAINMGCCATRSISLELVRGDK